MKKKQYCLRCGSEKIKGFWELGCMAWGTHHKRHIWKTHYEHTCFKCGKKFEIAHIIETDKPTCDDCFNTLLKKLPQADSKEENG